MRGYWWIVILHVTILVSVGRTAASWKCLKRDDWLARRGRRDREAMISDTYIPVVWFIFYFLFLGWLIINHSGSIILTFPASTQTKYARHSTYQLIPVQRTVHTQSPALSHPPQRPCKCLAEILESYTRGRYALIFYIYLHIREMIKKEPSFAHRGLFFAFLSPFHVHWPNQKKKKEKKGT